MNKKFWKEIKKVIPRKNKRRSTEKFAKTTSRHRSIVEKTHGNLNSWRGIFTR